MPDLSPTDDIHKIIQAAQALDDAGNDLFAQGHFDDALKSYTKALKLKRRTLKFGVVEGSVQAERLLTSVATSINNIGYLRQRSGAASTEQIMAAYKDSLQIKREILGKEHISVGKTLNNIGSVHFGTNDYEQAMEAYTEAMDIMISNLGQDHLDVATILSNIGDVHLAQRELEDARHYYSSSLKIRWAQLGDHDPKVVRLLEKIAAIEMADTPQKLARLRVFDLMEHEEDDFFIDSEGRHQVGKEFQILRESVKQDVSFVDTIKRQMALEMIRDKITIIREMRRLDAGVLPEDEETSGKAITAAADHNTSASTPMTSIEREQALSNVKERIKAIRLKNGGSSRSQSEEDSSDNSIDLLETTFEDVTLYAMSSPTKLENRFEAAVSFREG
jgi:tetratricopeptide (TPR) repeat protein